jgi:hypothetical protein
MTKYNNSKIYKIEPIVEHEPHEIYIGSTTKERLCQRMAYHKRDYNRWKNGKHNKVTVYDIFDKYGVHNCNIYLIENCPCNTKDELNSKEGHYIRTLECINRYIPDRTLQEYNKYYYEKNKDDIKQRHKDIYEITKEKVKEERKIYYQNNEEQIKSQKQEYYLKNKEKILEQIVCSCGCVTSKASLLRHQKSKKHIELMKQKEEN